MIKHLKRITFIILFAGLAGACGGINDPMSLLPISEQAYLKTIVPVAPTPDAMSVEQMLQNALVQADAADMEVTGTAPVLPDPLELDFGPECQSELDGEGLIRIGEFRRAIEHTEPLRGLILITSGDALVAICAFQQASSVVNLVDDALQDIVVQPDASLAPGQLRLIVEPIQ